MIFCKYTALYTYNSHPNSLILTIYCYFTFKFVLISYWCDKYNFGVFRESSVNNQLFPSILCIISGDMAFSKTGVETKLYSKMIKHIPVSL